METRALTKRGDALSTILADVGQAANGAAAASAFADYRSRRAANTLRHQGADLATFAAYLARVTGGDAPDGEALANDAQTWRGMTWGLVNGFCKWLTLRGYAIGTVNLKLSTVKVYASLAATAGVLSVQELAMIRLVKGYRREEGKRFDEQREAADIPTRNGHKKAQAVTVTPEQLQVIEDRPDTPQGRRDAVLVRLLADLGLRVGEVAALTVGDVNLEDGEVKFYRPKVDKMQTHKLTGGLLLAMREYMANDAAAIGPLLRASVSKRAGKVAWKAGTLSHAGMTERSITARVRLLGKRAGIEGLSAHDLRHNWATRAARNGTPLDRLRDAGGWNSLSMPLGYIEAARVSNEGVRLE